MSGESDEAVSALWVPSQSSVVGAGRMGTGIAHALVLAGSHVTLIDSTSQAVSAGVARVEALVRSTFERGRAVGDVDLVLSRLAAATGGGSVCGDLVIEAVPESVALKCEVLSHIENAVGDDTIIATNTSSISLATLATALRKPERFVGMHFFNPVPASLLVEVVTAGDTSSHVLTAIQSLVVALGKTPIVVTDSPGFASSRLGVLLGLEAIRMVEEGVASPSDIDTAMTLGYKHPMGPLRLTDVVGLDVRLGVAEYLATQLGPRFEPPELMRHMVAQGELGQKSGRGFYDW